MSAQFAQSTASFVNARQATGRSHSEPGWLQRAAQWLIDLPRRRAVINELDALSDHELADIGLDRGDVARVFDRGFAMRQARG